MWTAGTPGRRPRRPRVVDLSAVRRESYCPSDLTLESAHYLNYSLLDSYAGSPQLAALASSGPPSSSDQPVVPAIDIEVGDMDANDGEDPAADLLPHREGKEAVVESEPEPSSQVYSHLLCLSPAFGSYFIHP